MSATALPAARAHSRVGARVALLASTVIVSAVLAAVPAAQAAPPLHGAIGNYYASSAQARAELGQPTTGENCGLPAGGCYQQFFGGRIYWTPGGVMTHVRNGGIADFYNRAGAAQGSYGYPSGPVTTWNIGDNGWYLDTKNPTNGARYRLVWSNDVGTVPVYLNGGIGSAWAWDPYRFGYPLSPEQCSDQGVCKQSFQHGDLTWSPKTGTQFIRAGMRAVYMDRMGGINSSIGAPRNSERALSKGGAMQDFTSTSGGDSSLVWNPQRQDAYLLNNNGAIAYTWRVSGAENGQLAFPTSGEIGGLKGGGAYQTFQGGFVMWSPSSGSQIVGYGGIFDGWRAAGAENGSWGYPTSSAWPTNGGGWEQRFQGGLATQDRQGRVTFASSASMSDVASAAKLGNPDGGAWTLRAGVAVQTYQRGVVVTTAEYGSVAMNTRVFQVWAEHPQTWGLPSSSQLFDGAAVHTTFSNAGQWGTMRVALDTRTQKVVRTDMTLGKGDVLTIGDSQVWDGSWVGRGIQQSGYNPVFYRLGGIGFAADAGGNPFGSYGSGVIDNAWPLPQGSPEYIFIAGSGNDVYVGNNAFVKQRAKETIRHLKAQYPGATIVVGGVTSQRIPSHQARWEMDDLVRDAAREEGVRFFSEKYLVTDSGGVNYLADGFHFNDPGQVYMAPFFAERFQAAIR